MTIIEKPQYFKKYRDKNGDYISLGDVVYGEDGKAFEVREVVYKKGTNYPIIAHRMEEHLEPALFDHKEYKLKPKWLTHEKVDDMQAWIDFLNELTGKLDEIYVAVTYHPEEIEMAKEKVKDITKCICNLMGELRLIQEETASHNHF